jgi:cephalosporin-C deacetylase
VILSPNITLVSRLDGGEAAAAPANERWGDVRFTTSTGAYLELTGGSRIWGPWLGRQVWEVSEIAPGQKEEVAFRVGVGAPARATLKQLVAMRARWASDTGLLDRGQPLDLSVSVINRSDRTLHALLSLELSGSRTELVIYSSSILDLPARESRDASFRWQVEAPDFYTARANLSVADREVAGGAAATGYRVDDISPAVSRPADFQQFWDRFLQEAGDRPPQFRMVLYEDQPRSGADVWTVQYDGLGGKTIYGWYLVPTGRDAPASGRAAPAILYLSGYGARPLDPPTALARDGYVVLAIDTRGTRVDRIRPRPFEDYCTEGIMSPDAYVYREIAGHALRGLNFLQAREETDPKRIAVVGVSEGGGVGLLLAALSPKVKAVVAAAPMLCDFPLSLQSAAWPYAEIARYRDQAPDGGDQVNSTLSYFDAVNFAPQIECPVLLTVGFLDRVSLPAAVYGFFNLLSGPKQLRALPDVGHEGGGDDLWTYGMQWLAETLHQGDL